MEVRLDPADGNRAFASKPRLRASTSMRAESCTAYSTRLDWRHFGLVLAKMNELYLPGN